MTYRYHPSVGIFVMAAGAVTAAIVLVCFFVSEAESELHRIGGVSCGLSLALLLFGAAGYITSKQHIAVNANSLTYYFAWLDWTISWESLRYWCIDLEKDTDNGKWRCARFFAYDRNEPAIEVREYEAAYPGFEQFISDVRHRVGSKERVSDGTIIRGRS